MQTTLSKKGVISVLKEIYDPEIPINIYDLGLIYALEIDPEKKKVYILMTVTAPGCPIAEPLAETVRQKLYDLGFKEALRMMGYPI